MSVKLQTRCHQMNESGEASTIIYLAETLKGFCKVNLFFYLLNYFGEISADSGA